MIEEEGFTEKWRQLPEFPEYWISDTARVFNSTQKTTAVPFSQNGVAYFTLYKNKKSYKRSVNTLERSTHASRG